MHVLCCGLPLLIAAGVFGGMSGASLATGNAGLAAGAGVLVVGLVVWLIRRRGAGTSSDRADCCVPDQHPVARSEYGPEAPDRAPAVGGTEAGK